MVRIESNIPVPPPKDKYPWGTMKVGDSFLFPETRPSHSVRVSAVTAGKRWNRKFRVGVDKGRLRCWRVK